MRVFIVVSLLACAIGQTSYKPDEDAQHSSSSSYLGVDSNSAGTTNNYGENIKKPKAGMDFADPHFVSYINSVQYHEPPANFSANPETDQPAAQPPNVQFYTFTADENDFIDPEAQRVLVEEPSKIFLVMSPVKTALANAAVSLAQKTTMKMDIYVMDDPMNIDQLAEEFNDMQRTSQTRPAVYFINLADENNGDKNAPNRPNYRPYDAPVDNFQHAKDDAPNVKNSATK